MSGAPARFARRRRPQLALGCVVAGLALAPAAPALALAAAVIASVLAAWAVGGRSIPVAALLVLAGAIAGSARLAAIDRPARAAPPGTAIEAGATLLERPRPGMFGSSAVMRIDSGPARGLRVFARNRERDWPGSDPGARFRIRALVTEPEPAAAPAPAAESAAPASAAPGEAAPASEANAGVPGTPGFGPLPARADDDGFDYAAFLRSRAIGREVRIESLVPAGRRGGVAGIVDGIRIRAERGMAAGLPPELAALARGMVLGEDGDVPADITDDFRRSGLAHLTAASGQNVALLCALALPLLMLARASIGVRVGVLLPLVALYVVLAGSGASVVRAGVMAVVALVAVLAGRPASATYALLVAAAVTLACNPRATGDPGWRLSFAAVAGMLVLGPRLAPRLRRLPRPLAEALGATCAATLATAPLMAHEFGTLSLTAVPANVVAFPAVAPVMWGGMAEALVAQAAVLGTPAATASRLVTDVAGGLTQLPLRWVAATARHFSEPAWAQAAVDLSGPAIAVGSVVAVAVAAPALAAVRRLRAPVARRGPLLELLDGARALSPRRRRRLGALAAAATAAGLWVAARPPPPATLTVDFLDVGQGDATLVRDATGAAVLFDGGPPEARVDRILRRLGVRRLSAVVATHQSRDHHGGLAQVLRRFPVGLLLDGGDGTSDPTFVELEREAERRRIPRRTTRRGEVVNAGALRIRILWPPPRPPGPAPADPNPRATVAIVSAGDFDLLLSADAESPSLLPLRLPRVEAMKVPHHGSEDPGLPRLLGRLRPAVAAIETGRGNRYGHPRPATLAALRGVPRVYRTDRDGTIELSVTGGRIAIRTHR